MKLSLCMIVKNEEMYLGKCLESVKNIVDEMIIVDTGSTDNTIEIAQNYGAKIYHYEWNNNFSDARNFSLKKANGDWILIMDGDDKLDKNDASKIIKLLNNENIDIYLFQTLSYVGSKPNNNTISNLNIRLIRNTKIYEFEGAIHEQIRSIYGDIDSNKVSIEKIRIYHYGYLSNVSKQKDKPRRNMKILKEIAKNNQNNFTLFNLGSEYLRLKEYEKALACYKKIYKKFNPKAAYIPKMIVRMSLILDTLKKYDEENEVLNTGLKYYPSFTDLIYLKACMYHKQKKYTLAINEFKKCIEMGEAPLKLSFINDVGNFRPNYALAEIYKELGDNINAHKYYLETIKTKRNFIEPLYKIGEILVIEKKDINFIKQTLQKFFNNKLNPKACIIIGDILFGLKKYNAALEYFKAARILSNNSYESLYYEGITNMHLKKPREAYSCFKQIKNGPFYEKALYKMILCEIYARNIDNAEKLLKTSKKFNTQKTVIIYEAFKNIICENKYSTISDDKEESAQYIDMIFILLNLILRTSTPEMFEKSLGLLNLIKSDEVLLRLAKLYFNNEYYELAYQEIIRSIKILNKIDSEAISMMKKIVDKSPMIINNTK